VPRQYSIGTPRQKERRRETRDQSRGEGGGRGGGGGGGGAIHHSLCRPSYARQAELAATAGDIRGFANPEQDARRIERPHPRAARGHARSRHSKCQMRAAKYEAVFGIITPSLSPREFPARVNRKRIGGTFNFAGLLIHRPRRPSARLNVKKARRRRRRRRGGRGSK